MLRLFHVAGAVFILSWVPLFIVGLSDPTSNPIGLGLLGMAGTALAVILFAAAVVIGLWRLLTRG